MARECFVAQLHFLFSREVWAEYAKAHTRRHTQTQKAQVYVRYTFIVYVHIYM